MKKPVDPDSYLASKGIRPRVSSGDGVLVAKGPRAGERGTVTFPPDGEGRMGLRFAADGRVESWGLSEVDLSFVRRDREDDFDEAFSQYHARILDVVRMQAERGPAFATYVRSAFDAYYAVLPGAPEGPDRDAWMAENHPAIAAKVARIERESAAFAASRDEAVKEVDTALRLALDALGAHAARSFLARMEADPDALPSDAFFAAVGEATELRVSALDGVRSGFDPDGTFMRRVGQDVARAKGWPRKDAAYDRAAVGVLQAILQPIHVVARMPPDAALPDVSRNAVTSLGDGRYAIEVTPFWGVVSTEVDPMAALRAVPGVEVERSLVRDPTLSRHGIDYGAVAAPEDLKSLGHAALRAEVSWLEHAVEHGRRDLSDALAEAKAIADEPEPAPAGP